MKWIDAKGATCDDCGGAIRSALPGSASPHDQPANGMVLFLTGGYGEYIDPVFDGTVRVLLCEGCCNRMFGVLAGVYVNKIKRYRESPKRETINHE